MAAGPGGGGSDGDMRMDGREGSTERVVAGRGGPVSRARDGRITAASPASGLSTWMVGVSEGRWRR